MGLASAGISIDRNDDRLSIVIATHRSGDFVHYIFGSLATLFGITVFWIGLSNGTLFGSWITIPLILAALGYGWFALTRAFNRRVLTVSAGVLSVGDKPLFSLASGFEMSAVEVGKIEIRRKRRWVPAIWWHTVYHVTTAGAPDVLFAGISSEEDATRIRAALVAHLAGPTE